jgi:hypothetical protein
MRKVNEKNSLPLTMEEDIDMELPSWKASASDRGHTKSHQPRRDTQVNKGGIWLVYNVFKAAKERFLCHVFTTMVHFLHLFSFTKTKIKEASAENATSPDVWIV